MKRYMPQNQLSIKEFSMPFDAELNPNNRWVIMAGIIPWDTFAREYYKHFKTNRGAPTLDARLVLGVVIIKHVMKLDDQGVIEMIQENPYMQYFLGLSAFTHKPVMDSSSLVHIRRRIDLSIFEAMTDELMRRGQKLTESKISSTKKSKGRKKDQDKADQDNHDQNTPSPEVSNKGKLQLDATVADAEIKFPTDLDLLNQGREKAEELIDFLYGELQMNVKPRDYRREARKNYLNLSKKKRKGEKELRKGIKAQINYLKRDVGLINKQLDIAQKLGKSQLFDRHQLKYFYVIQHLLVQQREMFKEKKHSVENRIVSIHQPHIRPIIRGKAKAKVEFGAKINVSLDDGYARIDHFDWNAFNEGVDLPTQVERYREFHGYYPALVQVDKIYLNRENRRWLKERGIQHTGDPLGRKQKVSSQTAYQKRKKRKDCAERNRIEGKFGQGKRGYGLNDIKARTSSTSMSWIGAIVFVMNIIRHMESIPTQIISWLKTILMRMKQLIEMKFTNPTMKYVGFGIIQ